MDKYRIIWRGREGLQVEFVKASELLTVEAYTRLEGTRTEQTPARVTKVNPPAYLDHTIKYKELIDEEHF